MKPAEITAQRKALGLSQPKLAALLGVDVMTVNRWEKGHQSPPPYLAYALRGIACERSHAPDST
jgi:DNA-binding transcriptional regulator YiaG